MHTYTLTITKEDFWLEFKSEDKKIIEKELGIWITSAAKLLEETITENPIEPAEKEVLPEKVELGSIVLDEKKPAPEVVKSSVKAEITETLEPEKPAKVQKENFPTVEEKPQHYKISDETKEILQRAIHKPLPSMNEMLKPEPETESPTPESIKPQPTPVQKVKPVMPATPFQKPAPETVEEPTPVVVEPPQDFTTIYNQKIAQENNSTDRFAQLLSLSNIRNKFDCLIACAYHLVERENFERFTLKQINTLSKALLEEIIEHDTLKEALEKRFIKIVPDYTGIATTMEYTLTDQGVQYFKDVIAED
ncbi:MAG: hypothetical protein WCF95_02170 [bacterium]